MAQVPVDQTLQIALQHHQAGRLEQAETLYRQILAQQPNHADALHFLGVLAYQAGRHDMAVDLIRQAIALKPDYPQAWYNLANALHAQGHRDDAIAAFRQAIALKPDYGEAHNNLGNALRDKGQLDNAMAAYRQAIALNPDWPDAHNNLGNALKAMGQLDEAIAAYRRAIVLRPNLPEAHYNLANALSEQGQLDDSIAAYQQAIALKGDYAEACYNLGNALKTKGQLDDALAAYRRAIALKPGYPEAYSNLGTALRDMGQLDQTIAAYRQAIALKGDWAQAHSNLVYTLHFHPAYDARTIAQEHGRWNAQHAEPLRSSIQPHGNDRNPERRLRIGYVSPDFREHPVACNLLRPLAARDREHFEVFCYCGVRRPDALTQRFVALSDAWRSTTGLSDDRLAQQIRHDGIDILVDLSLHLADNRLLTFARKPAPVQVTFAGYPGSTGLSAIDYRLTDPYLDPPGGDDALYSESSIRLPDCFWCYDPLGVELPVNPLPAAEKGSVTFGCLNTFCKVNDEVLALWARVLNAAADSHLIILSPVGSHRQRTLQRLGQDGIDPARIEFVPPQPRLGYLELYHRIDVGLDTFPYNGHTTSLDAFWMGVPVVTLTGRTAVGRAGLCQLMNLGLGELAADRPEEYVRIAVDLASDLPRLGDLRATLRRRMEQSPLMDGPRFARNLEAAYRRMWRQWCAAGPSEPGA